MAAGLLILASGRFDRAEPGKELTPTSAVLIGLIQGLCLPFRGFWRSATISVGLMCGLNRRFAENSFALAVVVTPLIVRQTLKLLKSPGAARSLMNC